MILIRPAYQRNTAGVLVDADPSRGLDGLPVGGLVIKAEGGSALVEVVCGRDVMKVTRKFQVGPQRACWLKVAGWSAVRVTVVQIGTLAGATSTASAGWTTNEPPQLAELVYVEEVAAGSTAVPEGAVRLVPSVADAGAQQSLSLPIPVAIATPLAVGVPVEVVADRLVLTAPQTLAWILEGF